MTRIDNTQQLMMLVRQQLSRASRSKVARTGKVKSTKSKAEAQSTSMTQRLSEAGDFTEEEMQRALVHGILTEEFGDGLINEANFQQIVDRITQQLQSDSETANLLAASVNDLDKPK